MMMIEPKQVVEALLRVRLAEVEALALLERLETETLTPEGLLALGPELERACAEAERLAEDTGKVVRRCLALNPTPGPSLPLGF
jgi:hypothetical protein